MADIALFAPLGLAVSVADAVPELARKGRARLMPQVGLARVVGQFAVDQGYRRLAGLTGWEKPPTAGDVLTTARTVFRRPGQSRAGGSHSRGPIHHDFSDPHAGGHRPGDEPAPSRSSPDGSSHSGRPHDTHRTRSTGTPRAEDLAIPSYDSLSAPQVVQLLSGLSREEVKAVRRYEAATRGRRTILARAEQLLA